MTFFRHLLLITLVFFVLGLAAKGLPGAPQIGLQLPDGVLPGLGGWPPRNQDFGLLRGRTTGGVNRCSQESLAASSYAVQLAEAHG